MSKKSVTVDACRRALASMDVFDCDDAGTNQIGFVGYFWGKWWFVTKCLSYDPSPNMVGSFSLLICDSADALNPPRPDIAFSFCTHQEVFGKRISALKLAQFIEAGSRYEAR